MEGKKESVKGGKNGRKEGRCKKERMEGKKEGVKGGKNGRKEGRCKK